MSSEQLTPPPPEAERTARKPWRKPRLRWVKFAGINAQPAVPGTHMANEGPQAHHTPYDPNLS